MGEIVLASPEDWTRESVSEADTEQRREIEHAMNRMFTFIVTVLPAMLGVVALCEGK